jgi:hypothetical protein
MKLSHTALTIKTMDENSNGDQAIDQEPSASLEEEESGMDKLNSRSTETSESLMIYGVLSEAKDSVSVWVDWYKVHVDYDDSIEDRLSFSSRSYAIFDDQWHPLKFFGKRSSLDSAAILFAAKQMQQSGISLENYATPSTDENENLDESTGNAGRKSSHHPSMLQETFRKFKQSSFFHAITRQGSSDSLEATAEPFYRSKLDLEAVKTQVQDGDLPMVPVKRSSAQQFLIEKSVDFFFRQETVRFFACQPYRFSPRTIYRFPGTIRHNNTSSFPNGYVALTIDDAPCRMDHQHSSSLTHVLDLLHKYRAKATFMVIQQFLTQTHDHDMIRLLREGHELANHGVQDAAMSSTKDYPSVEAFVEAIQGCNDRIEELQAMARKCENEVVENDRDSDSPHIQKGVRWFRAPHGE